jgi:ankyrin repeat protein
MHGDEQGGSHVPLIRALVREDVELAIELLAHGADPNALDEITPLYAAQEYVHNSRQRHAMLRRLLKAGALADQATKDGSTTLMLAAYHGDVRSAQLLLDHGADPVRRNEQGSDAVLAAQRGGHSELASLLHEHLGESGLRLMSEKRHMKVEL